MNYNQQDWYPQKTWLFAVGILEWLNSQDFEPFPDAIPGRFDAKFVDFFRSRGVPERQIIYLQDQEATFEAVHQLGKFLSHTSEDDLLILYFAGHGDWDADANKHYFINYDGDGENRDTHWSLSSIFDDIENNFSGSRVLLLADCCYSGGLIDEAKNRNSLIAYACISSADSHNGSTGNWTFTECLCKGLLGDPVVDLDGDLIVTLDEVARYTELEMAFIEEQKSAFFISKNFDPQMQLASVSDDIKPIEGKRVMVESEGKWHKAKTLESSNGQVKVRYIKEQSKEQSEEWVTEERISPYNPDMFVVGDLVEVEFEGNWHPATVTKAWYGLHCISYDDMPPYSIEWVESNRIRPRAGADDVPK